jgi:hypothetical protein
MNLVSFATKQRLFWPKTPKNGIFPCHSNWVMWPIKIFGLSQGFLIFTLLGSQNEFGVFRALKTPFLTQNAKKRNFSLSFKLGHVTYQNLQLEPRIPNFHFTWVLKWIWCLSRPNNAFFDPKRQKTEFFLVIQTGSCDLSKYSAWAKDS